MQTAFSIGLLTVALLVLTCVVAGVLLVRAGLRGRRVSDHPVCRRCGFDLFGLPEDRTVCTECGADLTAPRAIQDGHRRRRPAPIAFGVGFLLLGLLIGGAAGTRMLAGVSWIRVQPTWWLSLDARTGDPGAWGELSRRAKLGQLSAEQAQPLVAHALAWQADATRVWAQAVGDFVEDSRNAGLVSDEEWKTYARQAASLALQWRTKVRKGDPLTGRVTFGAARVGSSRKLSLRVVDPYDSPDPLVRPPRYRGSGYVQSALGPTGGSSTTVTLELDPAAVKSAPEGKRTTAVKFTAQVRDAWEQDPPLAEWTQELVGDWELVGAEEQTVEVVPDDSPEVRRQVEQALVVDRLAVERADRDHTILDLNLKIGPIPVPLSYDVFLRAGPREWRLGSITANVPTSYGTGGHVPGKENFNAKRADVVFRPSMRAAVHTPEITRMWGGEVVVRDVEVKWPATQPTTVPTE